jgi:hypothetical protein
MMLGKIIVFITGPVQKIVSAKSQLRCVLTERNSRYENKGAFV